MKIKAKVIEHDGKKRTIAQWARVAGISPGVLRKRLSRGWSMANALTGIAPPRTAERATRPTVSKGAVAVAVDEAVARDLARTALIALEERRAVKEAELRLLQDAINALYAVV
jgi:hypothetical protein